jgi:glycosyltransferase involved in cell wall biosynthesis
VTLNLDPCRDALEFHFSPNSNEFWREIGHMVADGFEANDFTVVRHETASPASLQSRAIHVAVGGHEYFNTFLKEEALIRKAAPAMVALTGEQPGSQWFSANLPYLSECKECWDITQSGTEALQSRGLKARHLQLGFSKRLRAESVNPTDKPLDVLFLASLTHERSQRIAEFGINHWHLESHFQLAEIGYAKTAKDKIYLSNADRNRLAARSKIILNYHGHLIPFFEWHRALVAMANESLFLTDLVRGSYPLVAGRHYISASSQVINHAVDFLLDHLDMRQEITGSARRFLNAHLQMEHCAARFARGKPLEQNRIAGELGPISSIQKDLQSYLAKMRRSCFPINFAASCTQKYSSPAKKVVRNQLVLKRNEMAERLEKEISVAALRPPYDLERFPGVGANSSPVELSVVISLFNYESAICTALDSILFASANTESLEVVVVDDGSTDESVEAARQWLAKAPFRGVLICKHYNTGFISSRNIGIREALGEYIAILDADNAFLPNGIDRLFQKIQATSADACYGIIICVDEAGRPSGLLSAQPWDVRRLLYCPYVDAMAIFKKSTIEKLGFYDTEMFKHGWFGWEDYELWLRLAEANSRVEFVPNFVALYRSHSSSMINSTNLFQSDIIDYLAKKFSAFAQMHSHADKLFGIPKLKIAL